MKSLLYLSPRTRALAFVDWLLRCAVATLFALDAYRRAAHLLAAQGLLLQRYREVWSSRAGGCEWCGDLVAWALVLLAGAGAVGLLLPYCAAWAALLIACASGLEVATIWGGYWEPARDLPLFLGAVLVLVSQALLRPRMQCELGAIRARASKIGPRGESPGGYSTKSAR